MSKSEETTNFWNSCPLELDYLPCKQCNLGKPVFSKDGRILNEPQCDWWINSEKHHYCFWKYLNEESASDGFMNELQQLDLTKLFGCSSAKIHFMVKEAMQELTDKLQEYDINDTESLTDEINSLFSSFNIDNPDNGIDSE